jgi:glycosyltransferase involved in cell wall biosynthesis
MPRIKVLQLLAGVSIGSQSGGAELTGLQIARRLDRQVFDPALFVMFQYGNPAEKAWLEQCKQEELPVYGLIAAGGSLKRDLWNILGKLWHTVAALRPDILNSHSERGDFMNALVHCFHPVHPKSVRTVHLVRQWITRPWIGKLVNQVAFPLAIQAEMAVSDTIAQGLDSRLLARVLGRNATVCYNGIDAAYFAEPVSKGQAAVLLAGLPISGPRVGIIGRLAAEKGHAMLLDAMQIVRGKIPAHLVVVGSGALEEDLFRQSRGPGIEEYTHFLGNRRDIVDILHGLDLVVSASTYEAFPTVILEAMSQQVPVIATDVPGNRDLVKNGDTGLLTPAGDAGRLAEAILYLLSHPDQGIAMAARARQFASRFTIQNTTLCHARIYKALIPEKNV